MKPLFQLSANSHDAHEQTGCHDVYTRRKLQHFMDISTGYMLGANDIEVHATPTLISQRCETYNNKERTA